MIASNIIGRKVETWECCSKDAEGAEADPRPGGKYAAPWIGYRRKLLGEIVGVNEENWTLLVLFSDGRLRPMTTRYVTMVPSPLAPARPVPRSVPGELGGVP